MMLYHRQRARQQSESLYLVTIEQKPDDDTSTSIGKNPALNLGITRHSPHLANSNDGADRGNCVGNVVSTVSKRVEASREDLHVGQELLGMRVKLLAVIFPNLDGLGVFAHGLFMKILSVRAC
jgi:hypothetical protein